MTRAAGFSSADFLFFLLPVLGYLVLTAIVTDFFPVDARLSFEGTALLTGVCLFGVFWHSFHRIVDGKPFENYLFFRMNMVFFPTPTPKRFIPIEQEEKQLWSAPIPWHQSYKQPQFSWKTEPSKKNVVIFLVESLRSDYFAQFMPKLRARAERGWWFQNHFSSTNSSMSAYGSVYWGILPIFFRENFEFFQSSPWVKLFKDSGYACERFVEKFLEAPMANMAREFTMHVQDFERPSWQATQMVLDKAIRGIENASGPFFFDVFIHSSHCNYYYHPRNERFKPVLPETMESFFLLSDTTPEIITGVKNRYRNALGFLDDQFEEFFSRLEKTGLDKNTVFVFLGDHGESLGESGFFTHCSGPHQTQFRVPLIILAPEIEPQTISAFSQHADLISILSPLLGYSVSGGLGKDPRRAEEDHILVLENSTQGRLLLFRQNRMTLFDLSFSGQLSWLVTTDGNFTLDQRLYSLYSPAGIPSLTEMIKADGTAVRDFWK